MFRLEGNNIFLRLPGEQDVDHIFHWENDTDNLAYNVNKEFVDKSVVREWIRTRQHDLLLENELRLMICVSDGRLAGSIDLFEFNIEHRRAGLGIIVEEQFRNKGIATEALLLVKDYCFRKLKMNSLWCNISASNALSIGLFEKCGFELSGTKRKWNILPGEEGREKSFEDELFFQCFPS